MIRARRTIGCPPRARALGQGHDTAGDIVWSLRHPRRAIGAHPRTPMQTPSRKDGGRVDSVSVPESGGTAKTHRLLYCARRNEADAGILVHENARRGDVEQVFDDTGRATDAVRRARVTSLYGTGIVTDG